MSFGKKGLTDFEPVPTIKRDGEHSCREPRVHRLMKVIIRHERFGSADAVIRDISTGGLGGRCNAPLYPGDVIDIDRPGLGQFEAEVRWVRGGHFGAQLTSDMQIDTKAVDSLSFSGTNWDAQVHKPLENHVFTRFKPVKSTHRPFVAPHRRDPI